MVRLPLGEFLCLVLLFLSVSPPPCQEKLSENACIMGKRLCEGLLSSNVRIRGVKYAEILRLNFEFVNLNLK